MMDKETRENAAKVRSQKADADRHIWNKVPPKVVTREEAGYARRQTPQREVWGGEEEK